MRFPRVLMLGLGIGGWTQSEAAVHLAFRLRFRAPVPACQGGRHPPSSWAPGAQGFGRGLGRRQV